MRRTITVYAIAAGFIAGIVAAQTLSFSLIGTAIWILLVAGLVMIKQRLGKLVAIGSLAVVLGAGRWELATRPRANDASLFIKSTSVSIEGTVSGEVLVKGERQQAVVTVSQIGDQNASGKVQLNLSAFPEYRSGDQLRVECNLQHPFSEAYARQLARRGIGAVCGWPRVFSRAEGKGAARWIFLLKQRLIEVNNQILPEPYSALLGGLLWGGRSALPADIQDEYRRTGMAHQVAVSGFNTTLIAAAMAAFFLRVGLPRPWVVVGAGLSLLGFVIMTGATAAVVRAALMSQSVLVARLVGRPASAGYGLLIVALGMVAVNPWLLQDIGFQLSVAATAGLVALAPLLSPYFTWMPARLGLQESLVTTMAALLATTPVSMAHFGQVSPLSPLANVLTVPLLPLAMAVGGAAIAAGFVWVPLGTVVGYVAWIILKYLLAVPHLLAQVPLASFRLPSFGYAAFLLYLPLWVWVRRSRTVPVCPAAAPPS